MIMEKKKQKEISNVENQSHEARIKSQADADFYLVEKQAQANKVRNCAQGMVYGVAVHTMLHCK